MLSLSFCGNSGKSVKLTTSNWRGRTTPTFQQKHGSNDQNAESSHRYSSSVARKTHLLRIDPAKGNMVISGTPTLLAQLLT